MGDLEVGGAAVADGGIRSAGDSFTIDGFPVEQPIDYVQSPPPKQVKKSLADSLQDRIASKVGKVIEEKLEKYIDKFVKELDEKLEELLK